MSNADFVPNCGEEGETTSINPNLPEDYAVTESGTEGDVPVLPQNGDEVKDCVAIQNEQDKENRNNVDDAEKVDEKISGVNQAITNPPVEKQDGDDVKEQSMANADALLETISKYKKLVSHKKCHAQLLQDPTISGFLVLCLGEKDPQIVERSFEVFHAIAQVQENLPKLHKVNYFVDALRVVAKNASVQSTVRLQAKNLISELKSLPKTEKDSGNQPLSELSESMKNCLAMSSSENCNSVSVPSSASAVLEEKGSDKHVDLNTTMSTMKRKNKGRETVLFIENNVIQRKSERTKITQALIGVPGIISVTYDLKNNFCVLRGKRSVAPEEFARSVATLGLANTYLVRKNEKKEEVKILVQATEKENMKVQYPPYPEEVENEEADDSAALARTDKNPDNQSFFKSAKNFIKRSFYW